MITKERKIVQKVLNNYRLYIDKHGEVRDFGAREILEVYNEAADKNDTDVTWTAITFGMMYGYMKGYKRAIKDSREKKKALLKAATVKSAVPGSAATDTREM